MEEYFDKIEQYLTGNMLEEERSSFEAELAQNKELKDSLEAHRLAHDAMEVLIEDNLRAELKKMQAEVYPTGEKGPSEKEEAKVVTIRRLWPRLAVAASVLLLIGFFTFQWAGNNYSTPAIAGNFYNAEDLANVRNSKAIEYSLEDGVSLIREEKYAEALQFFRAVPDSSDFALKAQYFIGLSLDQLDQNAEAREALKTVINNEIDPLLSEKAEWLTVLTYLKTNDTDNPEFTTLLTKISDNPDHSYQPQAIKLKQQLGSIWHKMVKN